MANKISIPNKNDDSEFDPNETLDFLLQIKTDTQKHLLILTDAYKDVSKYLKHPVIDDYSLLDAKLTYELFSQIVQYAKDIGFIDNILQSKIESDLIQEISEKIEPDNLKLIEQFNFITQINNATKTMLVLMFEISQELVQRLEVSKKDSNVETMRVLTQASEIDFIITRLVQYAKKIGYIEIGLN
jgi:hypothetical protein